MYGDPDPYSTADKSQSCQSEYIDFTIACVVGTKRGEGEGEGKRVKGKGGRNEKGGLRAGFPFPFSLCPIRLKTPTTQSNDLQKPSDFCTLISRQVLLMTVQRIETKDPCRLCLFSAILQDTLENNNK